MNVIQKKKATALLNKAVSDLRTAAQLLLNDTDDVNQHAGACVSALGFQVRKIRGHLVPSRARSGNKFRKTNLTVA